MPHLDDKFVEEITVADLRQIVKEAVREVYYEVIGDLNKGLNEELARRKDDETIEELLEEMEAEDEEDEDDVVIDEGAAAAAIQSILETDPEETDPELPLEQPETD